MFNLGLDRIKTSSIVGITINIERGFIGTSHDQNESCTRIFYQSSLSLRVFSI
jgi:hypothetical protein